MYLKLYFLILTTLEHYQQSNTIFVDDVYMLDNYLLFSFEYYFRLIIKIGIEETCT